MVANFFYLFMRTFVFLFGGLICYFTRKLRIRIVILFTNGSTFLSSVKDDALDITTIRKSSENRFAI